MNLLVVLFIFLPQLCFDIISWEINAMLALTEYLEIQEISVSIRSLMIQIDV